MTAELWVTLIGAVLSAGSLIMVAIINTNNQQDRKKTEERAERRATEARLSMDLCLANASMSEAQMNLTEITFEAASGGHLNGNVERAKTTAEDARSEVAKARSAYEEFMRTTTAKAVAKT